MRPENPQRTLCKSFRFATCHRFVRSTVIDRKPDRYDVTVGERMTRPRSPRRYPRSRAARLAVPLAIPMALGLTLGIVLAVSGGGAQHTAIQQAAANATPTPGASASAAGTPSASPSGSASAAPAPDPVNVSCDIIVPAHPLSAAGLATPYQLTGTDGESPGPSGGTMANFPSS